MSRQSITFTDPNDEWLKNQINSREYSSKSEVINDLIRRERRNEKIQARLRLSEQSGFTSQTKEEILSEIKKELGIDG